ncbi:Phosphate carrier protein, mitochondrial [Hordeum vulgare]|nr:Phosphate carrier protein, mitochondrial [Hordeum vulgare]
MQVDPSKYREVLSGFDMLLQEQGLVFSSKVGWPCWLAIVSTIQGASKLGFYEYFKKCYSDFAGSENADRLNTVIYLASSASAELVRSEMSFAGGTLLECSVLLPLTLQTRVMPHLQSLT